MECHPFADICESKNARQYDIKKKVTFEDLLLSIY